MKEAIAISINKTIAQVGILLILSFAIVKKANAQCEGEAILTIDNTLVAINHIGNGFCTIQIPYDITNPGPCDISGFTIFFSVTSIEGTENIATQVVGPLSANVNHTFTASIPSMLLFNDVDDVCFDADQLDISASISPFNGPSSLTTVVPCPYGNGLVMVCQNDSSIICDDSFCEPYDCGSHVSIFFDEEDLILSDVSGDSCQIQIPYTLTGSGSCDLGSFDIIFMLETAEGAVTMTQPVGGYTMGTDMNGSFAFSSELLEDADGNCYELDDITLIPSIPVQPDIQTETVPCPYGVGEVVVCASNPMIVCDDSACIPPTCDVMLEVVADQENISFINSVNGQCQVDISYTVLNNGFCDLGSFNYDLVVNTPTGTEVVTVTIAGPLAAGGSVNGTVSSTSLIYSDGSGNCLSPADIILNFVMSAIEPAIPMTTTVSCDGSLGTMEVCVNNPSIICDDSECEVVLPVEFLTFEVRPKNESVRLDWQTVTEINNNYFYILHSTNGTEYETIGMLKGQRNSYELTDYEFIHEDPWYGTNYYKLAIQDMNGHLEYSDVRAVTFEKENRGFSLAPNPAMDYIDLRGLEWVEGEIELQIFTLDGRLMSRKLIDKLETLVYRMDVSYLPEGMYYIQSTGHEHKLVNKFLKL